MLTRTALITGSTSGIGLEVAKEFVKRRYNVILNGFGDSDAAVKEVASCAPGSKVSFVPADLSKANECRQMVLEAAKLFGRLDVLVNNAGIQHVAPVVQFPEEQWDRIIALNLNSVFHCTKAVLPFMTEQQFGRIVNISSVHGLVGSANKSAYVAAKHGVIGFSKVLTLETAKQNITVNSVCPGWVLTPLVHRQIEAKAAESGMPYAEAMEALVGEKMPTGVPASAEEIAMAVAYLADDRNVSTRGVALNVDGGWVSQ
jgi:3-hydroxybutyrate dehydrogenase